MFLARRLFAVRLVESAIRVLHCFRRVPRLGGAMSRGHKYRVQRYVSTERSSAGARPAVADLAAQVAQLKQCIEHCPAPIAMCDRNMRYLAVSRRWCEEFDIKRDPTGMSHYEALPDLPERWKAMHARCLLGASERCEEDLYPRADGSIEWVRWEVRPWRTTRGEVGGIVIYRERITRRRQAEQALRQREARMELLIDAVPHLVAVLNTDGSLVHANAAMREYFGADAPLETAYDRSLRLHPDDRVVGQVFYHELPERRRRAATTRQPVSLSEDLVRLRRVDDTYRWFRNECKLVKVEPGEGELIIATATDVDALKQSEASLNEAQARLQAALRVGGIGLLVWEVDQRRASWDDSLLCLIGRTREDLESRSFASLLELIHEDDREPVQASISRALQTGAQIELECRVARPDGRFAAIEVRACLERPAHGPPTRVIAAVVDVTHRKQLEAQVLQAQRMDAIGQLAGGIAHDFNNLLTVVLGQTSLLKAQGGLPARAEGSIQDIDDAAKRAAELTRQLLAFARGQLMQPRVVDLNQAISETVTMLRRILGQRISLTFEPSTDPLFARVDTTMLSQLLLNLTVNARDAMEQGGQCSIRTCTHELDAESAAESGGGKPGRWACVAISDSGCGIAPELLPRVFEPFFTTKPIGRGTGLGLSTVYGILKQHGGFVQARSTPGVGSTFYAYLPWVEAPAPTRLEREPSRAATTTRSAKILMVEDEPAVRAFTRTVLEQLGHHVSAAEHAAEAMRIWRQQGQDFDLVLTDMIMPGGTNGAELIAALRRDKPGLKAILCSGYSLDTSTTKALGVDDLVMLQKPWTVEALRHHINDLLGLESAAS